MLNTTYRERFSAVDAWQHRPPRVALEKLDRFYKSELFELHWSVESWQSLHLLSVSALF